MKYFGEEVANHLLSDILDMLLMDHLNEGHSIIQIELACHWKVFMMNLVKSSQPDLNNDLNIIIFFIKLIIKES